MNTKNGPIYKDKRGEIEMVKEDFRSSYAKIRTNPGEFRANHYHKNSGGHWVFVERGSIIMYERPTGTKEIPKKIVVNKGEMWFTQEYVDHIMSFNEETLFHCFSLNPRDSATYENDTVRLTGEADNLISSYQQWEKDNAKQN